MSGPIRCWCLSGGLAALLLAGGAGWGRAQSALSDSGAKTSPKLVPLTDLVEGKYLDFPGGLYGGGLNEPPAQHAAAAQRAAADIQPLDAAGRPARDGKIVLLALGMSNTGLEFQAFRRLTQGDRRMAFAVLLVNGAQGGVDAKLLADEKGIHAASGLQVWPEISSRLRRAGATPDQVQVVWLKEALLGPAQYGEFPGHAERLRDDLARSLRIAHDRFPNLRLAFLSSRIYGGYAVRQANPEPYAYESGFAVQWLIHQQLAGDAALNFDPLRGKVRAPVLLWGPYLWADGPRGRQTDGLVWRGEDFMPRDGVHPAAAGQQKVARLLNDFFMKSAYTRPWFAAKP